MRVALAAVLFSAPDLLLLDEPTNYLDLEGAMWLVDYLETYPATVLVISHDRDLLDDVANHILHLDRGKLTLWTGGYSSFERQRAEMMTLAGQGREEAGGAAQAPAILRRPLPRQRDQGDAGAVAPEDAGEDGADRGRRSTTVVLPFSWPPVGQEARLAAGGAGRRGGRLRRPRRCCRASASACRPTTASA